MKNKWNDTKTIQYQLDGKIELNQRVLNVNGKDIILEKDFKQEWHSPSAKGRSTNEDGELDEEVDFEEDISFDNEKIKKIFKNKKDIKFQKRVSELKKAVKKGQIKLKNRFKNVLKKHNIKLYKIKEWKYLTKERFNKIASRIARNATDTDEAMDALLDLLII